MIFFFLPGVIFISESLYSIILIENKKIIFSLEQKDSSCY
jgi:hypothetical protein